MSDIFVDYFKTAPKYDGTEMIFAGAKNKNMIIIRKLSEPHQRLNGQHVSYEMDFRELSVDPSNQDDEAWACVEYQEYAYWSESELRSIGIKPNNKKKYIDIQSVFDKVTIL